MRICKPFASPFQSTCPARGTTLLLCLYYTLQCRISIHVPREGHDQDSGGNSGGFFGFQSTCPARGTTRGAAFPQRVRRISIHVPREGHDRGGICLKCQGRGISIHVPREGHDPHPQRLLPVKNHFNPRAPRGARLYLSKSVAYRKLFQSTCPARGTTGRGRLWRADRKSISIHVPREGHDLLLCLYYTLQCRISIHVPREGHDHNIDAEASELVAFQSTCPARGTTFYATAGGTVLQFQSTCPARGTTAVSFSLPD